MNNPHRRYNPLCGEYVLVSPHRTQRPWQGAQETVANEQRPQHDPKCYLCPGNTRANGEQNPNYQHTYFFTNDFSALLPENIGDGRERPLLHADGTLASVPYETAATNKHPLLQAETTHGECRVLCFSPRHDLTLAHMSVHDIEKVITLWREQITELCEKYQWVQIFENKGAIMGCSNPHPHGQIWASDFLPNEINAEDKNQLAYWQKNKTSLLVDYTALESDKKERVVCENKDWLVVVPFWAVWPFETLLLPKRAVQQLTDLTPQEQTSLAEILKDLLQRYDALFETSFPYSMGWHGAPFNQVDNSHWQLHAHFYPPLLRSATVKKFMVGYELLAEAQRDITPEQAAERLRNSQ